MFPTNAPTKNTYNHVHFSDLIRKCPSRNGQQRCIAGIVRLSSNMHLLVELEVVSSLVSLSDLQHPSDGIVFSDYIDPTGPSRLEPDVLLVATNSVSSGRGLEQVH